MTPNEYRNNLIKTIDDSLKSFDNVIPKLERALYDKLILLAKDLDIRNGKLLNSAKNLKLLGKIKNEIKLSISNPEYNAKVKTFLNSFDNVDSLHLNYFKTFNSKYSPSANVAAMKQVAMQLMAERLTETGIPSAIADRFKSILLDSITSGTDYAKMLKQVQEFILGNKTENKPGELKRLATQVTTDGLHQYSAIYAETLMSDLNIQWFQYVGSNVEFTRTWCKAMVKKRYVHKSEFAKIIKGDFPEFQQLSGKIYEKTGLPQGMIPATDESNLRIRRGGYNCGHQFIEMSEAGVPKNVRIATYTKAGISFNAEGYSS